MSPRLLWYSQNRAVSMRPEQNSLTLAIWSDRVMPCNPLGEPVDERLDFREKAEHLLVDSAALCIVVADGGLGYRHRASHVDLLHLVGLKELAGETRTDRRQELGDDQFLGLKHPLRLAFSGRSAIQYNTVFNRDSFQN